MFFVVQKIKHEVEGQEVQFLLGCVSEHADRKEAEEKAAEVGKTAPGTFYVTEVRGAPVVSTMTTRDALEE